MLLHLEKHDYIEPHTSEREEVVTQALIAFDTDHIKRYVFNTNKLKEIRGASSILDRLNRKETVHIAQKYGARTIYANGGSALFLVDARSAEALGKEVQRCYQRETRGGASITYAIQPLPDYDPRIDIMNTAYLGDTAIADLLELLRFRQRMAKESLHMDTMQQEDTLHTIAYPSHPFFSTCDSCGMEYAQNVLAEPDDEDDEGRYCQICTGKHQEDQDVKKQLENTQKRHHSARDFSEYQPLWERILEHLQPGDLQGRTLQRPKKFDSFQDFSKNKEYIGLIYADGNQIGERLKTLRTLQEYQDFAQTIDDALFAALGHAISVHLPLNRNQLPFDVLLVGGDDVIILVPAEKAMQIAFTLAKTFSTKLVEHYPDNEALQCTLSVSVVLAPIKYPFSLQRELSDATLKAAKKAGALYRIAPSLVNFVVVTGNISMDEKSRNQELQRTQKQWISSKEAIITKFQATLRPYTLDELDWLLKRLEAGNKLRLGRTKLHQLREAILRLNNTITVLETLATMRNWQEHERTFIMTMVQKINELYKLPRKQVEISFPWFSIRRSNKDKHSIYQTPLLDFIELYDFVAF
jgi:GGDEF domain-containing protein